VIQEAYVHGVSTRKVDELGRSLGMEGISKNEMSRFCSELDVGMKQFRDRKLEGRVHVRLARREVRQGGRVENHVAFVAAG